ncbi:MAG: amidohydrolase, partial [Acidobacteriota bacterium]
MRRVFAIGFIIFLLTVSISFSGEENPLLIKVKPAKLTPLKKEALTWVDGAMPELARLNDEIWRSAEVAMEEYRSAEALAAYLEKMGFAVERGVGGLPTAFVGVYGSGEPVV